MKKYNSWFTLLEVLITSILIWIIWLWIFSVNDFFMKNSSENRINTVLTSFWEYVSGIVNNVWIPEECRIIPFQTCYIYMIDENHFWYKSWNPDTKAEDIWFFTKLPVTESGSYSHEIQYLWTWEILNIPKIFYHYKISVSYEWKKLEFYTSQ